MTQDVISPYRLTLQSDHLWLDDVEYELQQELGRGKSAISWLYRRTTANSTLPAQIVLKRYCQTGHQTIDFSQALAFELCSYQRLQCAGIAHPRLLAYSHEHYCLAKAFIAGELISDLLIRQGLDDRHFRPMFAMAQQLEQHGFHIGYFPTNFVLNAQGLFYIDYEAHPYNGEWDFANWGIYYWLNRDGMRQFIATGDVRHINQPGQPKPWVTPFQRQRESLMRRLANGASPIGK